MRTRNSSVVLPKQTPVARDRAVARSSEGSKAGSCVSSDATSGKDCDSGKETKSRQGSRVSQRVRNALRSRSRPSSPEDSKADVNRCFSTAVKKPLTAVDCLSLSREVSEAVRKQIEDDIVAFETKLSGAFEDCEGGLPGIPERLSVFPSYFTAYKEVVEVENNYLPPLPRFLVPVRRAEVVVDGDIASTGGKEVGRGVERCSENDLNKENSKAASLLRSPVRKHIIHQPKPSYSISPSEALQKLFVEANNDNCETCGGAGELLCCDNCPCSFHFLCCEPPEDPELVTAGEWLCNLCRSKREDGRVSKAHWLHCKTLCWQTYSPFFF